MPEGLYSLDASGTKHSSIPRNRKTSPRSSEGVVSQVFVEPDSNLVPTERVEVPFYLGVVETLCLYQRGPHLSRVRASFLQSLSEATERFATDLYAVHEIEYALSAGFG